MPRFALFKPVGLSPSSEVVLTVGEFEAIRLKDLEGLPQEGAAKRLGISQPTLHRILVSARKKLADVLVNGKSVRIGGGRYEFVPGGRGR